ncbi:hypothetical protein COY23_02400 [bacterium (Candidatus Torokbacteria) CG_4_10_14_0_2_um_filter_35_8]|nr:MAG: hypothetical protein COY23_02400 [bacterium (Candidatus Torokbacteria) CG_4_10_14_0_2_um_filter_35_8]
MQEGLNKEINLPKKDKRTSKFRLCSSHLKLVALLGIILLISYFVFQISKVNVPDDFSLRVEIGSCHATNGHAVLRCDASSVCEYGASNNLVISDEQKKSFEVSRSELKSLYKTLEANKFLEITEDYVDENPGDDVECYRISVRANDKNNVVQIRQKELPKSLQRIIDKIESIIEKYK